jgi:hypothetical protein
MVMHSKSQLTTYSGGGGDHHDHAQGFLALRVLPKIPGAVVGVNKLQ